MSGENKKSDGDEDRFEMKRRKALGKLRMTPYEADDGDTDGLGDYAFAEPTDEDLKAIEDDWEEEEM